MFEARGQCGAHCDTVELGEPGFLHNTHAVWLVPAMSPAMEDLGLEAARPAPPGHRRAVRQDLHLGTQHRPGARPDHHRPPASARTSEHDAKVQAAIGDHFAEHLEQTLNMNRRLLYGPPTAELLDQMAAFDDGLVGRLGLPLTGDDVLRMTGLELLDMLFESEEVRTTPAALGEFTGQWPSNRRLGPLALSLSGLQPMAVHTAVGGSHALTHALVKCVVAHGGEIWTTSPVERILVEDGKACGIRLAEDSLLPGEEIRAGVVISNLTLAPTFLDLVGEDVIGVDWSRLVKRFNYDDPQLLAVFYALSGDPVFASAAHDPSIQRSWVGYFGGETLDELGSAFSEIGRGVIPDEMMGGWFIPTRADPSQAPAGCHTAYVWVSVPPSPRRWRGRSLDGWDAWPELAEPLADADDDAHGAVRARLHRPDHRAARDDPTTPGDEQPLRGAGQHDRRQRHPRAVRGEPAPARHHHQRGHP